MQEYLEDYANGNMDNEKEEEEKVRIKDKMAEKEAIATSDYED